MTAKDQVTAAIGKIDDFMAKYPTVCMYDKFEQLEKKTKKSKIFFFLGAIVALLSTIFFVGGMKLISDVATFVYPAYASFKAIDGGLPGDDTQWLTYWVIFASMNIIESAMPFVTMWIPLYFPVKLAFFIWLYHPQFLGAGLVYTKILRPYMGPYLEGMKKNPQSPGVSVSSLVQEDKKDS